MAERNGNGMEWRSGGRGMRAFSALSPRIARHLEDSNFCEGEKNKTSRGERSHFGDESSPTISLSRLPSAVKMLRDATLGGDGGWKEQKQEGEDVGSRPAADEECSIRKFAHAMNGPG